MLCSAFGYREVSSQTEAGSLDVQQEGRTVTSVEKVFFFEIIPGILRPVFIKKLSNSHFL
jgi:hypothetical protein